MIELEIISNTMMSIKANIGWADVSSVEYVPFRILMELRSILWNRHGRLPIPCMQRYVLFSSLGSMVI